jgi:hypothetical protein
MIASGPGPTFTATNSYIFEGLTYTADEIVEMRKRIMLERICKALGIDNSDLADPWGIIRAARPEATE